MKTVLDLHLSAQAAALENLGELSRIDLHKKAIELSEKDGFGGVDYDQWFEVFIQQRSYFQGLKQQPTPAERAKKVTPIPSVAGQPAAVSVPIQQTANPA
jgi:hypothetical protein